MQSLSWLLSAAFCFAAFGADTLPLQTRTSPDKKDTSSIVSAKPNKIDEELLAPQAGKPRVGSLDTYGSTRINEVVLREIFGKEMDRWIAKGLASDPTAVEIENKIIATVKKKFGFPFAEWSIIQYFEPGQLALHLTLDVVEDKDVARRMPFSSAGNEQLTDPGDLLKQWEEYEEEALKLVESGKLEPDTEKCAALHCPFGHKMDSLKKYEKLFVEGAKKYGPALVDILKRDKRSEYRAAAVYVLAYWVDQKKTVADALVERVRDPDAIVRNNALRVLGDIATNNKDIVIPTGPILPALDYPKVSDRSKALYLVYLLSLTSNQVREEILKSSVPTLVALMECKQPDHKELAHQVLRKISGKEFAATDSRAWLAWYRKLPQSKEISKK